MVERIDKTSGHKTPGAGLNKEVCCKHTINTFFKRNVSFLSVQ